MDSSFKISDSINCGSSYLVLGSAPNPHLPREVDENLKLICVNASGWSAVKLRLPDPEITFIYEVMPTLSPRLQFHVDSIKNLKTKILLFIKFNPTDKYIIESRVKLAERNYCYQQWGNIDTVLRNKIIREISHSEVFDISTGVFAVCFALYYRASKVIIAGISFGSGGHNYTTILRPRDHIEGDTKVLKKLLELNCPVYTSEPELSELTGIPLV